MQTREQICNLSGAVPLLNLIVIQKHQKMASEFRLKDLSLQFHIK